MLYPNGFSPNSFEGPECFSLFLQKILKFSIFFLPKKYEGFHSSVVEQWSSKARVVSPNLGQAKTFFLWIYLNSNFSISFLPSRYMLEKKNDENYMQIWLLAIMIHFTVSKSPIILFWVEYQKLLKGWNNLNYFL